MDASCFGFRRSKFKVKVGSNLDELLQQAEAYTWILGGRSIIRFILCILIHIIEVNFKLMQQNIKQAYAFIYWFNFVMSMYGHGPHER